MKKKKRRLKSKDVAHILDISPDEVIELARNGELQGTKEDKFWTFRNGDVQAFKEKQEEERITKKETTQDSKRLRKIKKTTKCEKGFACLSHEIDCVCSVEEHRDDMLLFVKAPPDKECMYKMPLGDSSFCVCPMRAGLYRQHAV